MRKALVPRSRFLSLVLRHRPETIGVELDEEGWVDIDALLTGCARTGNRLSRKELEEIVETNDKKRFVIEGGRIRANQGHSVEIDLGLEPTEPPEVLYHGTVKRFLPSIQENGIVKGERQHVHLSGDSETATKVGSRRGKPIILKIDTAAMVKKGHQFFLSENGVWLTDHVPTDCIYWEENHDI